MSDIPSIRALFAVDTERFTHHRRDPDDEPHVGGTVRDV